MSAPPKLASLLESFFNQRLVAQRGATPETVASYRDAMRLLVLYAAERTGRSPERLEVADLDRDLVLKFLDHLEHDRGNTARTRNARLTAIRSFFHHVAASDPAGLGVAQRVLAIPMKRTGSVPPPHLTERELAALLDAPDQHTGQGRRDHALLLFLARTGARVSEAIGVDAADLRLERSAQVLLRGKGGKHRLVPLAADLVRVLRVLCREQGLGHDERCPVFVGARSERLTRFGVTHIVRRAVALAAAGDSSLTLKRVSPHVFRHTLAMQLLESGADLVTIQAWLGHAQVSTTHQYAEANVEMMRRSLESAGVTARSAPRYRAADAVLQQLENV